MGELVKAAEKGRSNLGKLAKRALDKRKGKEEVEEGGQDSSTDPHVKDAVQLLHFGDSGQLKFGPGFEFLKSLNSKSGENGKENIDFIVMGGKARTG